MSGLELSAQGACSSPGRCRLSAKSVVGIVLLAMISVMQGCATYSTGFAKVESATAQRDIDGAIKSLDELKLAGPDETLHHLNKATLLRLQGRYAESNQSFEIAKGMMDRLGAISVAEQAASVAINDTLKAYEGTPFEQLMVYSFEALNYLQLSDIEGAAVEARQFDVKQQLIAEKNKDAKYLSGAFVRYLNSMVYEAIGERDSARIELQKAIDGYKAQDSGVTVPQSLLTDFARIKSGKAPTSEVVFVLHNGLGASVLENVIRASNPAYDPKNPGSIAMVSLAVPKFVKRSLPVEKVVLSSGASSADSEVVEDVNSIAEKSFNDRLPAIMARGVARAVVKATAAQESKKKSGNALANIFIDIASNASERADTRSWSLLPGNIQMARLPLPPGKHDVTAILYGANGSILLTREYKGIEVKPKGKTFISDFFLNPPVLQKASN